MSRLLSWEFLVWWIPLLVYNAVRIFGDRDYRLRKRYGRKP